MSLVIENLSFYYPEGDTPSLSEITLSIPKGSFVGISGKSGSGKSTLLRLLKPELSPKGIRSGQIRYQNKLLVSSIETVKKIGFVGQHPDEQIVTDTVEHELAFGLESLGLSRAEMVSRIAEIATYFGFTDRLATPTTELSGGQKQLLNLSSVMVMYPEILLLDEPTAQLDPMARSMWLASIQRLHRDFGITILLVEHTFDSILPLCDQLVVLDKGKIFSQGKPRAVLGKLQANRDILSLLPPSVQLSSLLGEPPALTISEGKLLIERSRNRSYFTPKKSLHSQQREQAILVKGLYFSYTRERALLQDLSFAIGVGEIVCLFGGNGSGKSSLLSCLAGMLPFQGTCKLFGKALHRYQQAELYGTLLGYLPQDVQSLFVHDTVQRELSGQNNSPFPLASLLNSHPYDLSGGETQMLGLSKILSKPTKILLLDEPTKGMDSDARTLLSNYLKDYACEGGTVLFSTHDTDFAASCADRCMLLFAGELVSDFSTREFMHLHQFYTTQCNLMTRDYAEGILTLEETIALCGGSKESS